MTRAANSEGGERDRAKGRRERHSESRREGEGEREMVSASQWTEREDRQLQSMVRTGGPGNWRQKAEAFDTDRSADALRF